MLDLFDKLFPLIILLGFAGIGVFIWNLFAMEKYKKSLLSEVENNNLASDLSIRPKTLEQYRTNPDKKTLLQYLSMFEEFNKLALTGKMPTTSIELSAIKHTVSTLYFPLYRAKFKSRVYITAGLWLLMIPFSFWLLVVMAVFWVFGETMKAKNFTKFESLVNQYYSPQFKELSQLPSESTNSTNSTSIVTEIQKLENLRATGVINEDEFSQLKKKIISA